MTYQIKDHGDFRADVTFKAKDPEFAWTEFAYENDGSMIWAGGDFDEDTVTINYDLSLICHDQDEFINEIEGFATLLVKQFGG